MLLAVAAVLTALGILVLGVATSVEQRRSRRQPPPRPGSGPQTRTAQAARGHCRPQRQLTPVEIVNGEHDDVTAGLQPVEQIQSEAPVTGNTSL